ncbi:MAG: hypothetical protein ABI759_19665 [Candidatus Solibacter sp.]
MRNLFLLFALMTPVMLAQTSGSVTLTGSIPDAVSITNTSDSALSTTLTLGALVATNNETLVAMTPLDVRIRSNKRSPSPSVRATGLARSTRFCRSPN